MALDWPNAGNWGEWSRKDNSYNNIVIPLYLVGLDQIFIKLTRIYVQSNENLQLFTVISVWDGELIKKMFYHLWYL